QFPRNVSIGLNVAASIWRTRILRKRIEKNAALLSTKSSSLNGCHRVGPAVKYSPNGETMDYRSIITIEPGKRSGKPRIRGLRITVYDVLGMLAAGMSHSEILADFPYL